MNINERMKNIGRRNMVIATAVLIVAVATVFLYGGSSFSDNADSNLPQENNTSSQSMEEDNILIVYYSRTNNTEALAEIIRQEMGGDLFEVEPDEPYPEDYDAIVAQVDQENEEGYEPPLERRVENISSYDTVFFGAPTWDMQLPPPMKTFLSEHDLSGKTVVPFNTNGGYGVGSSFQTVEDRNPNADVLEGYSTRGGLERDGIYLTIEGERREEVRTEVEDWLQNIGFETE
jgi:flavodoxin